MSRSRDNSTQRVEHDARRSTSPPGSQETGITLDPFVPLLPQGPEALIIPEGFIGEEAVELLHEFVHPHHTTVETLGDVERRIQQAEVEYTTLPWWRTPSPWW